MSSETKPKKKNIASTVRELIADAVDECGCTLWDVDFVKEPDGWNLVVCIDREGGISLTDCEMVNDAIEPILDEKDPIEGSYCLEVTSPGIGRELKNHTHLEAFLGSAIIVKLYTAIDGSKTVCGTLTSHDENEDTFTLMRPDGTPLALPLKAAAKITLDEEL